MIELQGLMPGELQEYIISLGQPAFRARQVYPLIMRGVPLAQMTALPRAAKDLIAASATEVSARIRHRFVSETDGTVKIAFELNDGELVEGVLMRYDHGTTLCLSTQAGCRMGCSFCASTIGGLTRNLTAGEMMGMAIAAHLDMGGGSERRLGNVVLMGSGEPLDNYEEVIRFIRVINCEAGMNIGMRHISLSTCGLVDGIERLTDEDLPVTLSISLHAPDDALRQTLMPVANKWRLQELMRACREYISRTGRRVIFEYALIQGVNDRSEHAVALSKLMRGMQAHINLIPLNGVPERALRGVTRADAQKFRQQLEDLGVSATVRREMGTDIEGACGQLRRRLLQDKQG